MKVRPRLVEQNERWRAIETLLYSPKEVKQYRDYGLIVKLQQVLGLEAQETPRAK